jgi:hypothetical protein
LNSPDNGAIKNVAANAVSLNNGAVKVDVAALSGSYSGTFRGRSIEGQWTQPGGAIPLVLSPYEKPQLSKAAIDMLVGGWHGPLQLPGGSITFVVQFKESGQGELQGMWGVLEQGGAQTPLHDIEFADNKLSFKGPQGGEYDGTYAAGAFTGAWKTPGAPPQGMPLKLQKGELAPPVYALHLSASAFAALSGDWGGTMQVTPPQGQPVTLEMVVHFVTNQSGDSIGTLDSPTQHISGIPLTAASLEGGKVMLRADTIKGEFHGDLAGKTMTGQWMQGPTTAPLVLKKR